MKSVFSVWRQSYVQRQEQRRNLTQYVARLWRRITRNKMIRRKVEELYIYQEKRRLSLCFHTWKMSVRVLAERQQFLRDCLLTYEQDKLRRLFHSWRRYMMVRHVIRLRLQRLERKFLVRYFDAWRRVILRKKMSENLRKVFDNRQLENKFLEWKRVWQIAKFRRQTDDSKRCIAFSRLKNLFDKICASTDLRNHNLLKFSFKTWQAHRRKKILLKKMHDLSIKRNLRFLGRLSPPGGGI